MEGRNGRRLIRRVEERRREIEELVREIRRARFARGVACPRCSSEEVGRWGGFSGRRRYRCRSCGRTFSDLTATPASYLKKLELLRPYAGCLRHSLSVRAAARTTGISPSTAFRWRHRLLPGLDAHHGETLTGTVELSARRVPESCKGQRKLGRPARRRGPALGARTRAAKTAVAIAVDRAAHVVTGAAPYGWVRRLDLEEFVGPRCCGVLTVIAAEGRLGGAAMFARHIGASFCDARRPQEREIAAARSYGQQLGAWLESFRGVATKYLQNYLGWHRVLTHGERHPLRSSERHHLERVVLSWPVASCNTSREHSPTGPGGAGLTLPENENAPAGDRPTGAFHVRLAATYSPTESPRQYHPRREA
jgi:transposase-like protein